MDDPLIWVRAAHFASTISLSGVVFFLVFIFEPAARKTGCNDEVSAPILSRLAWLAGVGLIFVLISGAVWLLLQSARVVDLPLAEVFSDAVVWTVITQTDFGHDWIVRLVLAGLLSIAWLPVRSTQLLKWRRLFTVLLAASLVGTLAWAGHAVAGTGLNGTVHLTADILHLVAAAAWVGALVPLAVLLGATARCRDESSAAFAREAVLRFSRLGTVSVGTLLATGIVNTLVLAGSVAALVGTDYGRLLLLKIALFAAMLAIAGVNRIVLTPGLVRDRGNPQHPLRQLRYNSLIEAAIGAIILIIVGVLGTLPPGMQELAAWHQVSALGGSIAGTTADQSRCHRACQQARPNGLGHDGYGRAIQLSGRAEGLTRSRRVPWRDVEVGRANRSYCSAGECRFSWQSCRDVDIRRSRG